MVYRAIRGWVVQNLAGIPLPNHQEKHKLRAQAEVDGFNKRYLS
jgi:hypothetical protein